MLTFESLPHIQVAFTLYVESRGKQWRHQKVIYLACRDAEPFKEWRPWHCGVSTIDQTAFQCLGNILLSTSEYLMPSDFDQSMGKIMCHAAATCKVLPQDLQHDLQSAGVQKSRSTSTAEKIKFSAGKVLSLLGSCAETPSQVLSETSGTMNKSI